ncbi:DUF6138 family protein [Leucobacter albus]|uniref:DUF6138 family protein n=1 Tax=Leucobacter albus TaxID=272210 RepID=A0ABW3TM78_9MICO
MTGLDYLVFDDALRDPSARAVFDRAVKAVSDDTAQKVKLSRGHGFEIDGQGILGSAVLEYVLGLVPADEFDFEQTRAFTERMRVLLGWHDISYTLRLWAETRLCEPYFENLGEEWSPDWQLRDGAGGNHLPEAFFQFSCYVAIGELKHGPSYASVSANRIFDWVTRLGSDLPAQLTKHGTGELPKELASFRGDGDAAGVTIKANDALATIRIAVKTENEASYRAVLDTLVRLLETTDFPRSYAIEFRGPTKQYLPVKKLPKKGANQLFAYAVVYPALWPAIERYARAAMGEYEWYTNLDDEHCAMPGSFAVFALAIADATGGGSAYVQLALDYLREVDGEHQSLQQHFVDWYLAEHGFDETGIAYLLACAANSQQMRHHKTYPALIANEASLTALLAHRGTQPTSGVAALSANLSGEPVDDYAWRHALYVIWGDAAEQRDSAGVVGAKLIAKAPDVLRPLYEAVLA